MEVENCQLLDKGCMEIIYITFHIQVLLQFFQIVIFLPDTFLTQSGLKCPSSAVHFYKVMNKLIEKYKECLFRHLLHTHILCLFFGFSM